MAAAQQEFNIVLNVEMQPLALVITQENLILLDINRKMQREIRLAEIECVSDQIARFRPSTSLVRTGGTLRVQENQDLSATPPEMQRLAFYLQLHEESVVLFSQDKEHIMSVLATVLQVEQYYSANETQFHFILRYYDDLLSEDAVFDFARDRKAKYLNLQYNGTQLQFDYQTVKVKLKSVFVVLNRQYYLEFKQPHYQKYFCAHISAKQTILRDYFDYNFKADTERPIYESLYDRIQQEQNQRKFNHLIDEISKDYDITYSKIHENHRSGYIAQRSLSHGVKNDPTDQLIKTLRNTCCDTSTPTKKQVCKYQDFVEEQEDEDYQPIERDTAAQDRYPRHGPDQQALQLITRVNTVLYLLQSVGIAPELLEPVLNEIHRVLRPNYYQEDFRDFDYLFPEQNKPRKQKIRKIIYTAKEELKRVPYVGKHSYDDQDSDVTQMSREDSISDPRRLNGIDLTISTPTGLEEEEREQEGEDEQEPVQKKEHFVVVRPQIQPIISVKLRTRERKQKPAQHAAEEQAHERKQSQEAKTATGDHTAKSAVMPPQILYVLMHTGKDRAPLQRGFLTYAHDGRKVSLKSPKLAEKLVVLRGISLPQPTAWFGELLRKGEIALQKKKTVHAKKAFEDIDGSIYGKLVLLELESGSLYVCLRERDFADFLSWGRGY